MTTHITQNARLTKGFKKSALALFISSFVACPTMSQEVNQQEESYEVIEVSGIRASIRDSVQVKRTASNIVDGVSAEDIGQLPDVSIADSIRRIVGVNYSTENGDPAFASIRGLGPDLTLTTLNGRVLSTTDQATRRVSLGRLPSELVQSVYVAKSPMASSIEGGVAGTIGMQTIRPLSKNKRIINGVFRGLTDDNSQDIDTAKDYGWRGTLNYIDQFMDDRLGIAIGWAGLDQDSPNYEARTNALLRRNGPPARSDFNADGVTDITVGGVSNDVVEREVKRDSILGVIQYQVSDQLDLLFDVSWIKQDGFVENNRMIFENLPVPTNSATSADDVILDSATNIILGQTAGLGVPVININPNFNKDETLNLGFTADYHSDDWETKIDLSHSKSSRDRTNLTYQLSANAGTGGAGTSRNLAYDFSNPDYLYMQIDPVLANADSWAIRNLLDMKQFSDDSVDSVKVDTKTFIFSGEFIDSIEFGARYEKRTAHRDNDRDNIHFNGKIPTGRNLPATNWVDLSDAQLDRTDFAYGGIWRELGGVDQQQTFPHFNGDAIYALALDYIAADPSGNNHWIDGEEATYDYALSHDISEQSLAAYIQVNFATEINNLPIHGNFGLRVVKTEVNAGGYQSNLNNIQLSTGTEDAPFDLFFDQTDPNNVVTIEVDHDYFKALPSFNATLDVSPDLLLRFAAARTMSRAAFDDMTPGLILNDLSGPKADGTINFIKGNPAIEPFVSDQADLAIEWYPNADTTLAATLYYKNVSAYLQESRTAGTYTNNGITADTITKLLVNEDISRYFRGLELSYSQTFTALPAPFDGLGIQANAAFNETNAVEIGGGINGSPFEVLAREFSKEVYNFIGFYDKGDYSLRLAWQYQSPFTRLPASVYETRDNGQLDLTFSYKFSPKVKLIGSVTNLTDENIRVYRIDDRDVKNEQVLERITATGRSYSLGVRVNF